MRRIDFIVLHCTAGPQNQATSEIQAMWRRMGWQRPGYHFLINADGTIESLLPIAQVSNGVAGFNAHSIHISYKGGVGRNREILDNRTDQQKASMSNLVTQMHTQFPEASILGHRDFSVDRNRNGIIEPHEWMKSCPSFSVREWLIEINLTKPVPDARAVVQTSGGRLIVRSGPGTNHKEVNRLNNGTVILVLERGADWSRIACPNGINGWVSNRFI